MSQFPIRLHLVSSVTSLVFNAKEINSMPLLSLLSEGVRNEIKKVKSVDHRLSYKHFGLNYGI